MKKGFFLALVFIMFLCSCKNDQKKTDSLEDNINKPAKVTLTNTNGAYQLKVDGKPFYIKGAGLEFGKISSLAKHHANSFRTWRTDNGKQSGKEVLDAAKKYGLMVTMGIDMGRERHGFDYNDEVAVKAQKERIKKEVLKLKRPSGLIDLGYWE